MASTKQRGSRQAGKQQQEQQGRLLALLHRHGFADADALPPSTVAWLDTHPAFRWLAGNLSDANFVAPETQALYDAIQLGGGCDDDAAIAAAAAAADAAAAAAGAAAGGSKQPSVARAPTADPLLLSAIGISESDDSDNGEPGDQHIDNNAAAAAGDDDDAAAGCEGWDAPLSPEELEAAVASERAYLELLRRQLSAAGAAGRRLAAASSSSTEVMPAASDDATQQQQQQQQQQQRKRAALASLRAAQLRAAIAAAADANERLDSELAALSRVLTGWVRAAEEGAAGGAGAWLLCTADAATSTACDAEVRALVERGVRLVGAAAGIAAPPGSGGSGGGDGDDGGGDDDDEDDGIGMTPRSRTAWGSAGGGAADARRWRDQEQRNEGLKEELLRLRAAFKDAYAASAGARAERAGAEGALAAAQALVDAERRKRHGVGVGGGHAGVRLGLSSTAAAATADGEDDDGDNGGGGVAAVVRRAQELRHEARALGRERAALEGEALPALGAELALLNDTHVLEGEYDRQLAKMRVAHARKAGLIAAAVASAARALALREAQSAELAEVGVVRDAAAALEGVVASAAEAAASRERAYAAAASAALASAQRSTPAADDVFVGGLRALLDPSAADWAAVHAGGGSAGGGGAAALSLAAADQSSPLQLQQHGSGNSTAATIRDIASALKALGDSARASEAALVAGVFADLPAQLAGIAQAQQRLQRLVLPAGGGGGSGGGGSSSTNDQEEASSSSAAALTPTLTSPALAAAARAAGAAAHDLGGAINALLAQQADWAAAARRRPHEAQLERRVFALLLSDPDALSREVAALRAQVEAGSMGGMGPAAQQKQPPPHHI